MDMGMGTAPIGIVFIQCVVHYNKEETRKRKYGLHEIGLTCEENMEMEKKE